ncbi:MAG: radical SAM protein [Acutalibacteraceae bacterium]|nr:radical SAM protein [Acutalibacteraceae bacterium]
MIIIYICNLCPRECNTDRDENIGYCKTDNNIYISKIMPHFWEEPCISGTNGSGAVFFCGCNLGCIYCQNSKISRTANGKIYSVEALAQVFKELDDSPVHNINLVTPTHYAHKISEALKIYTPKKPIVYNTSSYEKAENLDLFDNKVRVFLADYKYCDDSLSLKYSFAQDYSDIALRFIDKALEISPTPTFDDDGLMTSGVIVRHLVLPGHSDHSMKCIKTLHRRYKDSIYISIMRQYTPVKRLPFEQLNTTVSDDEYSLILDYADYLNINNGFTQQKGSEKDSFIPDF